MSPKNWTCILWPITFTNIDQYQCHLIELFLQYYLIIYHKNYSHSRVPAATVTIATSALVQTNVCAITAHLPIARVSPSSICTMPHLISFLPTSGYLTAPDINPVDYRIWGRLQDSCLSGAHMRHQRAEPAPG